jgi:hypothetical protein
VLRVNQLARILVPDSGFRKRELLAVRLDVSPKGIGNRIREIRGKRFAEPFLQELESRTGHRISKAALSRMENGKEAVTLPDIVALAAIDPKGRGREWLAFGVYEARKAQRTSAPFDVEISPEAPRPHLQVAEQGRSGRATVEPSESPTRPTRGPAKRRP